MKKLAMALVLGCSSFTAFADEMNNDQQVVVVEASAGSELESSSDSTVERSDNNDGCGCRGKGKK